MNTQINITENGTMTLATAGKYCDRNIDIVVDVVADAPSISADADGIIARTATEYTNDTVTSIGQYAFYNYADLASVSFASVETVNDYAFQNCSNLTTANFPSVESIGECAFDNCTSLVTVNFPLLKSAGKYTFRNTALTSVTDENFPKLYKIVYGCFYDCNALTVVELLNNKLDYPGNYAFDGCNNLKSVKIGSVNTVSVSMFAYCTALEIIDFGSVNTINATAFRDTNLTTLIIRNPSKVATLTLTAITNTPIQNGTGYVYVPSALVDSYKTATNWSTVADQIRAIEDYPDITGG